MRQVDAALNSSPQQVQNGGSVTISPRSTVDSDPIPLEKLVELQTALVDILQAGPKAGRATMSDTKQVTDPAAEAARFLQSLSAYLETQQPPSTAARPVQPARPRAIMPLPSRAVASPSSSSPASRSTGGGDLPPLPLVRDASLLDKVFTHQGFLSDGNNMRADMSYEQLEFLGDAFIECICSRFVLERHPDLSPGKLSQCRELLVNNHTLAGYSQAYGLGERLKVPARFHAGSSVHDVKLMADVFEAYVAAVVLDGSSGTPLVTGRAGPTTSFWASSGLPTAEIWLRQLWAPKLAENIGRLGKPIGSSSKQDLAVKLLSTASKLEYVEEYPPKSFEGRHTFYIAVRLTGWGWNGQFLGRGEGLNKNEASHRAAEEALHNHPLIDEIMQKKRVYEEDQRSNKKRRRI